MTVVSLAANRCIAGSEIGQQIHVLLSFLRLESEPLVSWPIFASKALVRLPSNLAGRSFRDL